MTDPPTSHSGTNKVDPSGEPIGGNVTATDPAIRLTHHSAADFRQTRSRFDEQVPVLDPLSTLELVLGRASWSDVEYLVKRTMGPTGFVALARIDQGALFSLNGEGIEATLYLVGNPVIAQKILALEPAAALYAPFRAAIYRDDTGVHIAYDQPSGVFGSFGSHVIDAIAMELDEKIRVSVAQSCRQVDPDG